MRFESAAALRASLEERLRNESVESSVSVAFLRKRVVFERYLARLVVVAPDSWILKGALALDFRAGRSRATMDMDLSQQANREDAVEVMLTAARADLSDFFVFRIEIVDARGANTALRFRVHAELAGRPFDTVAVDIGLTDSFHWEPEFVSTPGTLEFAGLPSISVPVLPLEPQVAEKLHAYTRVYSDGRRSSRGKDLSDLFTIALEFPLDGDRLGRSIEIVFEERGTHEPPAAVPEPPDEWRRSFHRLEQDAGRDTGLDDAYEQVARLLDPILGGRRTGRWNPETRDWEG
jgi:hypothetical protein